eukprot:96153-Pyramimonas_sp.AAC.1
MMNSHPHDANSQDDEVFRVYRTIEPAARACVKGASVRAKDVKGANVRVKGVNVRVKGANVRAKDGVNVRAGGTHLRKPIPREAFGDRLRFSGPLPRGELGCKALLLVRVRRRQVLQLPRLIEPGGPYRASDGARRPVPSVGSSPAAHTERRIEPGGPYRASDRARRP